jgi:S-adenosylmethionine synthetase
VSILVDTNGTGKIPDEEIEKKVRRVFDLTPKGMIEQLDLRRPIYRQTAAYGHFGRNDEAFTWEQTTRVEDLKKA